VRRVVAQCRRVDFADIEHLSLALENPEMLDVSTLTKKQKFAFFFVAMTEDKGVPWKLLRSVVNEVLFWGESEEKITHTEVKFVRDASKRDEILKFKGLWR